MSPSSVSLLSVLLLGSLCVAFADNYDVCVVGGGASGAASAVFLKQLGYSVKLIERNDTLGGHCRTFPFKAPTGQDVWIDMGVQVITNSTWASVHGLGNWAINSEQFVRQFVPASAILPLAFGRSSVALNVNLLNGQLVTLPATNQTAFQAAFATLFGIVSQYPWLATGERPDPIPAFFFTPFADFIVQHNLQVLVDPFFNGLLFTAGVGSLDGMSTLTALSVINPSILLVFSGVSGGGFSLAGGCHVLYQGIQAYLGDIVTLNAKIERVRRSSHGGAVIKGKQKTATGHERFEYHCDKTVMAVYPLIENLAGWFDLTETEAALFSTVEAQGYLAMIANFTEGPLVAGKAFSITNLDPSRQYNLPAFPNLSTFNRRLPFGPAPAWANAETACTTADELLDLAWQQIRNIPNNVISNVRIQEWTLHQYLPHFSDRTQSKSPTGDTRLRNLQGTLNTYWVGAAVVTEGTTVVWNQAYKLISQNFPRKH